MDPWASSQYPRDMLTIPAAASDAFTVVNFNAAGWSPDFLFVGLAMMR